MKIPLERMARLMLYFQRYNLTYGVFVLAEVEKSRGMAWAEILAVPVTVAVIAASAAVWTNRSESESRDRELDATYVALAVDILEQELPPEGSDERTDQLAIRDWAVRVLEETSPVPISDELVTALTNEPLVNISSAVLRNIDFTGAALAGADLSGRSLGISTFTEAVLDGANLSGSTGSPDFEGASLTRADLSDVVFRNPTLRNADLSGANLFQAEITEAIFREAELADADLRESRLRADFDGANLTNADLRGADLQGSSLEDANLSGVVWDETTLWPDGEDFVPPTSPR